MCNEYPNYWQEVRRRKKEIRAEREAAQLSNQTTQHMCGGYNHNHNEQEERELKRKQKAEAQRRAEATQPKADTRIDSLKKEAAEWGGAANDGKVRDTLSNSN